MYSLYGNGIDYKSLILVALLKKLGHCRERFFALV